jgi:5-formyltetrahydrofolate cyclo-ligase
MPDTPVHVQKKVLRDQARNKRSALSPSEIEEKSSSICRFLCDLLKESDPVMVYISKPLEVNTKDLIDFLLSSGKRVIVPVIEKDTRTLRLSYITSNSVLVRSTFQVHEPVGNEMPALPCEVKTVVVPMLAFDQAGNRLGYGAGYFDRFLAGQHHLKKIGLAFTCLETGCVPCDTNDVKMDLIVTENGIFSCGNYCGNYNEATAGPDKDSIH